MQSSKLKKYGFGKDMRDALYKNILNLRIIQIKLIKIKFKKMG